MVVVPERGGGGGRSETEKDQKNSSKQFGYRVRLRRLRSFRFPETTECLSMLESNRLRTYVAGYSVRATYG